MTQSPSSQLVFPVEPYILQPGVYRFGTRVRSRYILWARHLGDDIVAPPGTPVSAVGDGEVVWAEVRAGSQEKRNWGGLIVLKHEHNMTNAQIPMTNFYSVYGHITDIAVKVGERVQTGQRLAVVAAGLTPENGWWKIPHLHFAIYVGNWSGEILPGYKRFFDGRTKMAWWRDPGKFIETFNKG